MGSPAEHITRPRVPAPGSYSGPTLQLISAEGCQCGYHAAGEVSHRAQPEPAPSLVRNVAEALRLAVALLRLAGVR